MKFSLDSNSNGTFLFTAMVQNKECGKFIFPEIYTPKDLLGVSTKQTPPIAKILYRIFGAINHRKNA